MQIGKRAMEMGRMLAEAIMYMEREEIAGPDYQPRDPKIQKWASQRGSVYMGGQKVRVEHPRLRSPKGEVRLKSYERLKDSRQFSDEMLTEALRGMSGGKYQETVLKTADGFGISRGSISHRLIEATSKQLKVLIERDLSKIELFAIFLDTVHRGGAAFVVALGLDRWGKKYSLGFWEGATENQMMSNI
jgi:hypothetical protein